ncbi:hypothetical protein SAY87_025408 [Trapa incisa]|uniref:Uncharacterized protein n=2 Tax=Trapa TaxID=22665 RepID=A0AAN7M3N5_TRANT|nr:hypothetical protein SAY87_025408 [Trapa incisa]KAK4789216.1 hypothetical protein SAY86_020535 [Trapa natans]
MGRQSNSHSTVRTDPTAASSSIALLQQRFRDLQRQKNRRELLQRFPEPAATTAVEVIVVEPPEPVSSQHLTCQVQRDVSVLLGPAGSWTNSQRMTQYRPSEAWSQGAGTSPWLRVAAGAAGWSREYESHSDVDTSLHL